MSTAVGLRKSFELTLPRAIKSKIVPGDFFRAEKVGAEIVLRPIDAITPEQAWFWSAAWQGKEKEAEADIKAGRISGPFHTVKDFMRDLKR